MYTPKILVVENERILLDGIREILEREKYEVITAENGYDALTVLGHGERPPDLILSDIMMPGMDGYDFLKEVRKQTNWVHIPFIFLTAKSERSDMNVGRMLGADDYLTKPFMTDELILAVNAKLERHKQIRDQYQSDVAELKDKIMTILHHELRTPLTYVIGYSDLLKSSSDEITADELRTMLSRIDSGAQRLRRLIEDFILLVELETHNDPDAFHLNYRIDEYFVSLHGLIDRYHAIAKKEGLRFVHEIDPSTPPILSNSTYMLKILDCMLDNAVKFSREAGTFALYVQPFVSRNGNAYACFQIVDDGLGIEDEHMPHIFEPFYQATRHQNEHPGTGSGLAIAKGLAELHGGKITCESAVDDGSTFTMLIPAAKK
jgi:two-component system sensor histidine kinase/response regulator